jgi:hypothetical protein
MADLDQDKNLSRDEFKRIYKIGQGPPKDIEKKMKWYWKLFA